MGVFTVQEIIIKKPKTFEEQLQILKNRNMKIDDAEEAIRLLKTTNYYRLTAYALQFKKEDNYDNKISLKNVYKLYKFDMKIRHLILEILESIEIAMRTYLAYNLSIKYGSEALENADIFKYSDLYYGYDEVGGRHQRGLLDEIKLEISKNRKELFVKHHLRKYGGHFPIWVVVEIFSFGMLSRTYANLNIKDQKEISRNCFKVNNELLESWLSNLSYIRNICAHYGRLYNRTMAITPKLHNKYSGDKIDTNRLFISILSLKELTRDSSEWSTFKDQLESLICEYSDVLNLKLIGFPENWAEILSRD